VTSMPVRDCIDHRPVRISDRDADLRLSQLVDWSYQPQFFIAATWASSLRARAVPSARQDKVSANVRVRWNIIYLSLGWDGPLEPSEKG
jgi:hypothetical protein